MGSKARRRRMVRIKRAYEAAEPADGTRILVDRLWPRGRSKAVLAIDVWVREVAPSDVLRRWFRHEQPKWSEFVRRYRAELADRPAALAELRRVVAAGRATLVYGARDTEHNQAVVLRDVLAGG